MKLSVSRDAFLARLGVAARGVSTRSSIQTLSGVRIGEEAGSLELQATDMEIGIRVKFRKARWPDLPIFDDLAAAADWILTAEGCIAVSPERGS